MAAEHVGASTVLIVEADPDERRRLGSFLEQVGMTVLLCPGPTEPDYTCVGVRDGACPLVETAEAVVLDMSLDSEAVMEGATAEELLDLYLSTGRPVVMLGSYQVDQEAGQLVRLSRHPDRDELVRAVHSMLDPAGEPGFTAGA